MCCQDDSGAITVVLLMCCQCVANVLPMCCQDDSGAITVDSLHKMLNQTLSYEEAQAMVRSADLKGHNNVCLMCA